MISDVYPLKRDIRPGIFVEKMVRGLRSKGVKIKVSAVNKVRVRKKPLRRVKELANEIMKKWKLDQRTSLKIAQTIEDTMKIAGEDTHLIHAHFAYVAGFVATYISKNINKPFIVTLHGYDAAIVPEINYGILLDPKLRRIVKYVLDEAEIIITVSEDLKRRALTLGNYQNKIQVIYHGINPEKFKFTKRGRREIRSKYGIEEEDVVIFTLSYHVARKNIPMLIETFKDVVSIRNNVKLMIGGEGPETSKLKNLTRKLKIEKSVIFTGTIKEREKVKYYSAADIFALTSLYEGFGIVLIEAMSTKLPIVATQVGGIPEVVSNNETGLLVPVKSKEKLANALLELIDNKELRSIFGENGRKRVLKYFTFEKMISNHLNIYTKIESQQPSLSI